MGGPEVPERRAETGKEEIGSLGREASALEGGVAEFESGLADAERQVEDVKDDAKRERLSSTLSGFRSRSGAAGRHLRAIVTGLSLLAAGAGAGKMAAEDRQQEVVMDLAKRLGAEEARNEALRAERGGEKREEGGSAETSLLKEENERLRKQAEKAEREEGRLRAKIEELQKEILAERGKLLESKNETAKMQVVAQNYLALFEKMRSLIDSSGNDEIRKDAERFIEAME